MASFKVEGLEELEEFFGNIAAVPNEVINKMLHAEADIVAEAQKRTAGSMLSGPYAKGDLSKSVHKGRVKNTKNGKSISIEFKGSRTRGNTVTSNAEIAYINEFGKYGQAARPFIETANEQCAEDALNAAGDVFDTWIESQ